jgi:S-adenosylmethionine hydrolase
MAAFILASAAPYFPKGTVHLAVVDPGVGTKRRAIVIQTKRAVFVGPDNGSLMLAAQSQGIERIHELSNPNLMLHQTSDTFHGRDIFAPAAAHIDRGARVPDCGEQIHDPTTPHFAAVEQSSSSLTGEILHIDGFGNLITNIKEKILPKTPTLNVKLQQNQFSLKLGKTYANTAAQEPVALIGSHGFLEIAVNQGSAAEKFGIRVGDRVVVSLV